MIISSCPKCDGQVSVPDADPNARVQCPLCQEEFPLRDLLDTLPPKLMLLDSPASAVDVADEVDEFKLAFDQTEPEPRPSDAPAGAPVGFDFGEPSGPAAASTAAVTTPPRARPKRKKRNMMFELIKIAGGGIVGLATAQLILWWLPGDWKKDPVKLAPAVGRTVPWIVPERWRPKSNQTAQSPEKSTAEPADGGPAGDSRSDFDLRDASAARDKQDASSEGEKPNQRGDGNDAGKVAGGRRGHLALRPGGQADAPASPSASQPKENPFEGVKDSPVYSAAEVGAALNAAHDAKLALDEEVGTDRDERRNRARDFYTAFCELAEKVTFVDPNDRGLTERLEAVHGMFLEFQENPSTLEMIGKMAASWLRSTSRKSEGIFLTGMVKQVRPQGRLYEMQIELPDKDKTVVSAISAVNPRNSPASSYQTSSRIVLLGTIVEDPASNLGHYEGDQSPVIWWAIQ